METDNIKIVGITGMNAAGKDTVADYLRDKYECKNYSLSDEIRFDLKEKGLPFTRDNMIMAGNEIREKNGANELTVRTIKRIKDEKTERVAVTSIRNPMEIEELKKNFPEFKMIFVDAPIELRYERAKERGRLGDGDSLESFKYTEEQELTGGKNEQQLLACKNLADYTIINDGSLEELFDKIENFLTVSKIIF